MTKHMLNILDLTGHTAVEWAIDAQDAIAEAERIFAAKMATKNYLAFRTEDGVSEQIHDFVPEATEITLTPRFVGG